MIRILGMYLLLVSCWSIAHATHYDKETGNFYNMARDYAPDTGRYIEGDPVGVIPIAAIPDVLRPAFIRPITAADVLNFHRLNHSYAYVNGNPISYVDPMGLVWEYSQEKGTLQHVDDATGARGPVYDGLYSGSQGYYNDPSYQSLKNEGPIPQGPYIIGSQYNSKNLGPGTMNLTPDYSNPTTYTFDRDLFRIHGDNSRINRSASEGCIIAPRNLRNLINISADRKLWVVP